MKRYLSIILLITILVILISSSSLRALCSTRDDNFGNAIVLQGKIELLNYPIKVEQLAGIDKASLMIIRNTIFAKYGYIFKSQELTEHFLKFSWYNPKWNNVENFLTVTDHQNIDLILKFEHNYDSLSFNFTQSEMELIGFWHSLPFVPAGYSNRYSFYKNREYLFIDNENNYKVTSGKWFILNSKIYLSERIIEGKKIQNTESILPLSAIENAQENIAYNKKIKIGNRYFWKFSDDPDFIKNTY